MELIIRSGGQTGVDQAALRSAKRLGLTTGGWMPKGFLTEGGPRPEFAELYGMKEHASSAYPPRTHQNVQCSDFMIWLGPIGSSGYKCTMKAANAKARTGYGILQIRNLEVNENSVVCSAMCVETLLSDDPGHVNVINVAGNRESSCPGIGERAEAFLVELFRELTK